MKYTLSIDWLSLYCLYKDRSEAWCGVSGKSDTLDAAYPWRYRVADYGTRQYKVLTFVDMPNEQGGWDDFAEVQSAPCSKVLNSSSVIVRLNNRVLYRPDMWQLLDKFLSDNSFIFHSISRIDICADFNDFAHIAPLMLISRFANKELRHIGRGVGALYFNHGVFAKTDENGSKTAAKEYGVNYTGLSFGTHSSDARVYLYNKSFELFTQGDKPWIVDRWRSIGLDIRNVWRLEISIKSKACTFKDKLTAGKVKIDISNTRDNAGELAKIYHTFVRRMFSFIVNRPGITNVTREPRLELFNCDPCYIRHTIRNISRGTRTEKMIIKALYLLGDMYRGAENDQMQDLGQSFACGIAQSTGLDDWMRERCTGWEQLTHK